MNKCDVIIPIYNAYESLIDCVESVINSTDLKKHRLILINDKSPDNRINEFLDDLTKKNKKLKLNIDILENKENLGFVKTVNIGMKKSDNDVLLLNSDTIVSKNWLEKIIKCAYSSEDVATVTPFSNNATLVSIPNCLQRNEIDNIDIEKYNRVLENLFDGKYNELPTGHGFCLFIKRNVLDEVGFFDEISFDKGYGEENDFCYRCLDYGYKHLLCNNTIVYHKESQSFKNKRNEVIKKHLQILNDRYPIYCQRTDLWLYKLPIKNLADRIYLSFHLNNNKANVLILIHDWDTKTGGTTLHVRDLISGLKYKYNFIILHKNIYNDNYVLSIIADDTERRIELKSVFRYSDFNLINNEYKEMIEYILDDFNISTIHIHHLKYHYFDILDIAKEKKIKTIITLHDFYCLCPTINMLEGGNECCIDNKNKNCGTCLKKLWNINNDLISNWQKHWYKFLKNVDQIIIPSNDARQHILKYYDDLKIDVIEHGIEFEKSSYIPQPTNKINVAMIGVLCNHKGGNILDSLIKIGNNKIKFHSFGYSEIESLKKDKKNYVFHGIYKRNNLHKLLEENKIDLICFFQKWPETYSYTLNEAISAGIPVLSFDIGAGAERIKKYKFGWVIDKNISYDEVIKKIIEIYEDKDDYNKKLEAIKKYKVKSINQMCKEYNKIYLSNNKIFEYKFDNLEKIEFKNNEDLYKLNQILNSTKWKLINKIKFPTSFVNIVRKVIKKGD